MKIRNFKNLGRFAGRFALTYLICYLMVGAIFLNLQGILPVESRAALDFYEPYNLKAANLFAQFLLGAFLALVLYPFYDLLFKGKHGLLILFGALWGVALLGNLEPKPGSIEGLIYTQTTILEHTLVVLAGAVQYLLLSLALHRWEQFLGVSKRNGNLVGDSGCRQQDGNSPVLSQKMNVEKNKAFTSQAVARTGVFSKWLKGYALRFTLIHLIIYLIVGSLFYEISGYQEALTTMEAFELWRPLESLGMVIALFFGQIGRGFFLALMLYGFYNIYMSRHNGWLLLFGLLFGLKVFPAIFTVPESLSIAIAEAAVGLPEIIVQTLVFSLVFYAWEKRRSRKKEALAA